jgi:Tol biopolymer transport system component
VAWSDSGAFAIVHGRGRAPAISPDGHWLAYESDESGRSEVSVRPFPAVDQGRWSISTGGGSSRGGRATGASCSSW